jgi:hypothetical protein
MEKNMKIKIEIKSSFFGREAGSKSSYLHSSDIKKNEIKKALFPKLLLYSNVFVCVFIYSSRFAIILVCKSKFGSFIHTYFYILFFYSGEVGSFAFDSFTTLFLLLFVELIFFNSLNRLFYCFDIFMGLC